MIINSVFAKVHSLGLPGVIFGIISLMFVGILATTDYSLAADPDAVATFGHPGGNVVVWGCAGGTQAYSIKGGVCNIGTGALYGDVTGEHVMWTSNLYRLHDNRFEQIGMSWIKHDDWAADGGPCLSCGLGLFDCNASIEEALDPGCLDVYDPCLNGYQHYGTYLGLGPRYQTNPWSGAWPVGGSATYCGTSNEIDCRLQVQKTDFSNYSGAQYFLEEQVIHPDESPTDRYNNVSYKPSTVGSCLTSNCDEEAEPPCGEALSCTDCGGCVYELKVGTGTCSTHSGCNDGEPCTQDLCIDSVCQHTCIYYQGGACENDSQCNDSDSCTNDACVENDDEPPGIFCEYTCPGACMACCKEPAIKAWQKADSSVVETEFQAKDGQGNPVDGRFILAAKAWQEPNTCLWNYEYALYNMNSERGGWKFSVPLPSDLSAGELDEIEASAGFHGISHHSGDGVGCSGSCTCSGGSNNGNACDDPADCPGGTCTGGTTMDFDDTDWPATAASGLISWETTPYATSQNANALRWGTLYNFRFQAPRPPVTVTVRIDLFKSGSPDYVTGASIGPATSGLGACCGYGYCCISTQSACTAQSGTFIGTNRDCRDCDEDGIADECESFLGRGACCLTDYSCIHTPSSDCCDEAGGVHWYGLGTNCGNIDCNEGPMGPQGP